MIGSFGNTTIKTPKMDLLSESSLNFTNAHCQQAICTASRASYLTGLRPDSTRVWDLRTHLRDVIPDVDPFPNTLRSMAITVMALEDLPRYDLLPCKMETSPSIHGKEEIPHTNTINPSMRQWKTTKAPSPRHRSGRISGTASHRLETRTIRQESLPNWPIQARSVQSGLRKQFEAILPWSRVLQPHLPFTAPKPYWDLYDPITDIDLNGYDGAKRMPTGVNLFTAPYGGEQSGYSDIDDPPTAAQARRLTHAYMACVSYVDEQVGKIIEELDRLGLSDSTSVVLFGDHGFHLADHGAFWAKHSNFENATRTPLIIRVPGMAHTGNFDTPVGLIDVFPPLADLCSLPYPKQPNGLHLEGTSLLPLIQDPTQPWKKGVFSQYQRRIWKNNSAGDTVTIENPGNGIGYSIRTRRYRYTEWWRTKTSDQDSKGNYTDRDQKLFDSPEMIELYDYQTDPNETVNLAQDPAHSPLSPSLRSNSQADRVGPLKRLPR